MLSTFAIILLLAPQIPGPQTPPPAPALGSPLLGGVPTGTATAQPLDLSLADAIDRALAHNLGLLLAEQGVRAARGTHEEALGDVLPHLNGRFSAARQKINLEAFGFTGVSGLPTLVGPFNVFDTRLFLSDELDLKGIYKAHAESDRVEAARWSYRDVRELVVLVTGNLYLKALADQGRIESARAALETARSLHQLAVDRKAAGLAPGVDVLRADVEARSREQRLIAAENRFARSKLDLARAIGLPLGQEVRLTDTMPSPEPPPLAIDDALQRAFLARADWKAAEARVRAAEDARRSARGEVLPGLSLGADYGAIGQTVGGALATYTLGAAVRVPLFQGGRVAGRVLAADAALESARALREDLRGRIDYEVRTATLDLQSALARRGVAEEAERLAHEQLRQAQDRFAAGVASNLDVVQAQQAAAAAEEDTISAAYDVNLARAAMARGLGMAEEGFRQLVRGH